MGIQERKEREKEQRKADIVRCATKVFLAKGFIHASMDEIAECAEFSKATLYLYYRNKEEIFLHVINNILDNFIQYIEVRLSEVDSAIDKIRMIGEAYLDFYSNCHGQYLLLNSQESIAGIDLSNQESYREYLNRTSRFWTLICAQISVAIEEGYFQNNVKAIEIAITLWSTSIGLMQILDSIKYQKLPENSDFQLQLTTLDYKKILRNLWDAILTIYYK